MRRGPAARLQPANATDPLDELPTLDGYRDGRQRWRHQALIREGYGYSDFTADGGARFRLTRWLYALCWAGDDRPSLLIDRATPWLVANKLLLPGISAIERLVAQVRHRTSRRAWRILAASLEGEQRRRLQALLDPAGDDVSVTLERLRAGPTRRTPGELLRSLARLEAIRAQGIRPIVPKHVPSARIQRLARFGLRARPSALVRLPEPRRVQWRRSPPTARSATRTGSRVWACRYGTAASLRTRRHASAQGPSAWP